ncbi:hypothetical protein [Spiroplasma taiwanense]|nr:hypothetical protein [Spiroplasma taiwanense]
MEESLNLKEKISGDFVTIGPREVMSSKKLIMIANGTSKKRSN